MTQKKRGKAKHPDHGRGLLAAVDIVIENTMAQHFKEDLTKHEIADYCEKHLPEEFVDNVIANALPNAIAARMRASKVLDMHGNEIRRFGSYRVAFVDEDLRERVYDCWKAWKHMSDEQMHQAAQAQINRAARNNKAVRLLIQYLDKEVRPQKRLGRMKLKWDGFKESLA